MWSVGERGLEEVLERENVSGYRFVSSGKEWLTSSTVDLQERGGVTLHQTVDRLSEPVTWIALANDNIKA